MQDLFRQHNLAQATHVLLAGDSAGGVGAMNNGDWIGSMLRYAMMCSKHIMHGACCFRSAAEWKEV